MVEDGRPDPLQSLCRSNGGSGDLPAVEEVRRRARVFERRLRWRNLREYASAALAIAVFAYVGFVAEGTVLVRVACALCVVGMLFMAVQLHRRGSPEREQLSATTSEYLASYRRQLERQRDLLREVWRWYLLPVVPGVLLFAISIPLEAPLGRNRGWLWLAAGLALAVTALVFLAVSWLNRHAARLLEREIEALASRDADAP